MSLEAIRSAERRGTNISPNEMNRKGGRLEGQRGIKVPFLYIPEERIWDRKGQRRKTFPLFWRSENERVRAEIYSKMTPLSMKRGADERNSQSGLL